MQNIYLEASCSVKPQMSLEIFSTFDPGSKNSAEVSAK